MNKSNNSNFNSSKLLEYRIDETYLSLKTNTNTNITTGSSVNNNINKITSNNPNDSNKEHDKINKIKNESLKDSTINNNYSSLSINLNNQKDKNENQINPQNIQPQSYFGYLNYFGGKLKENLSTITTGLGMNTANQNINQEQNK